MRLHSLGMGEKDLIDLQTAARIIVLTTLTLLLNACDSGKAPTRSFEVASVGAQGAALSDDGEWSIAGSVHQGGSLWRNQDGERLFNWNHRSGEKTTINIADFSPDGAWALTADRHTMVLWNVATGKAERFWTAPGEVLSISLANNGNYALLGLSDFRAALFDVKRGGVRRVFNHNNRVRSVDLSGDGKLALTGSEDYSATLWDVSTGNALLIIEHKDDVQQVALSSDGTLALSAAKYDRAVVWNTQSGEELGNLPISKERIRRGLRLSSAKFSADGKQLLTGRPDSIVQLWDIETMREISRWKLPKRDYWKPTSAAVLAVSFGGNNDFYAVASNGFVHQLQR